MAVFQRKPKDQEGSAMTAKVVIYFQPWREGKCSAIFPISAVLSRIHVL